ncbi:MAG: molybdopterin adenylyltransferase [Moraxella sp.]
MTTTQSQLPKKLTIGLISISDRASLGVYEDKGIPALTDWLKKAIIGDFDIHHALIADDQTTIEQTLKHFADELGCQLILTTGGTGPTKRDVTPEATLAIADKEMYGFGEQMRQISLHFVPTAILSRQVAVVRNDCLIINLPGQPKSIKETLEGVKDKDGNVLVKGIFSAVAYGVELISGVYFETDAAICESFRPKSAKRS